MSDALESRLIALFRRLPEADRHALARFAEFLASNAIPRPERESVIQAMRRLRETYPMLDRRELLGPASELLTQHMMQGRDAAEVIDALERLYRDRYAAYRAGFDGEAS